MRTFTFSDAKWHKFWNIDLQGNSFTVTYGRIGSKGQTQTKTFADAGRAQKEHDKLIQEKLAKGYRETTPTSAPAAAPSAASLRAALEAALIDNPDDMATHMAYADFLTEQGDPQGEFIQVQLALEDPSKSPGERRKLQQREKALLKAHQREWVGDWAALAESRAPLGRGQLDFPGPKPFRFIRGILAEVTLDGPTVACARAFISASQTLLVRRLFLGGFAWDDEFEPGADIPARVTKDEDPSQYVLLRWPYLSNLRVFQLGRTSDEVYGEYCHFECHLYGVHGFDFVKQMPSLEELYLFAHWVNGGKLFALPLPNLRVLQLYHSHDYPLAKLAKNSSLTRLTHLLCHPHALENNDKPYIRLDGLRAVLRSPHLRNLTHLRLRLADFGDRGCAEIVRSGILKRLKMLDLRHGCVSDEGAKLLAACPDLKTLESLDLSRNELTSEGIAALKAAGIPVDTDHQHPPTPEDEELYDMRFLVEGDYE